MSEDEHDRMQEFEEDLLATEEVLELLSNAFGDGAVEHLRNVLTFAQHVYAVCKSEDLDKWLEEFRMDAKTLAEWSQEVSISDMCTCNMVGPAGGPCDFCFKKDLLK